MVLVGSVVNRWFDTRRGLVTGVLGAANSTGQIIFVPLVAWLAVNAGWRVGVLLAVTLLGLVVLPLLILVFRNQPSDVGAMARALNRAGAPRQAAKRATPRLYVRCSERRSSGGWRAASSYAATRPMGSSARTSSRTPRITAFRR